MRINKQEKEYKYARSLINELNSLYKQQRNIEPIKLDNPIQHGYVRSLELNDEAKRRPDYSIILKAFNMLGLVKAYHPDTKFIILTGKHNKIKTEKHAYIRSLTDPHYRFYHSEKSRELDLNKIEEIKKALTHHDCIFSLCYCKEYQNLKLNKFKPHYSFRYTWLLNEITNPHFLTHYTPIDGELESRISRINRELYKNNYHTLLINKRRSWDKFDKFHWSAMKYDIKKDIIYHNLEFDNNGLIDYNIFPYDKST